jgi:hypothetical protein
MNTSVQEALQAAGMSQSRREALKRFGRYAAVAPTTMVLLEPRDSFAGKKRGRRGRKGRGGNSPY